MPFVERAVVTLGVVAAVCALPLHGQTSLFGAAVLSRGPADTTMQVGRQQFASYVTPGQCLVAARNAGFVATRTSYDTAFYTATRDTLPSVAVRVARQCGAQFTVDNVPATELLNLVQLELVRGNDARARTASERYIATAKDATKRWALYAVDTVYAHASPPRVADAMAITARLDSLGAPAALQRATAHLALEILAHRRGDMDAVEREALAIITASVQLDSLSAQDMDAGQDDNALTEVFFAELLKVPNNVMDRTVAVAKSIGYHQTEVFVSTMHAARFDWALQQIGTPAPPLNASYWIGGDSSDHVWPTPGKVSVYVQGWQSMFAQDAAMWKRLAARYGSAVNFVVMDKTMGYFHDGPPLTPAQEAERLGKYYRTDWGMPVTVAVDTSAVRKLPDGRRIVGNAPFEDDPYYSSQLIITDRRGKVVLIMPVGGLDETSLDAWIAKAVKG